MKIAVDLDDVVLQFFSSVLRCIKTEYDIEIDYRTITDWDKNAVKELEVFGQGRSWWDWLKDRAWLWATFPAVEGAIGGIDTLRRNGHYVECLTSKPEWAEYVVWAWLAKWRPAFQSVTIVPTGQAKHEVSDADLLIDDAPHNVQGWVDQGRLAIMFPQPWNLEVPIFDNTDLFLGTADWSRIPKVLK